MGMKCFSLNRHIYIYIYTYFLSINVFVSHTHALLCTYIVSTLFYLDNIFTKQNTIIVYNTYRDVTVFGEWRILTKIPFISTSKTKRRTKLKVIYDYNIHIYSVMLCCCHSWSFSHCLHYLHTYIHSCCLCLKWNI